MQQSVTATTSADSRELFDVPTKSSAAPYSSAVAFGDLVWTSGALPIRRDGTVPDDFSEQVRVALSNLFDALQAGGADWSTVLKISGFVDDIELLPALNEVYLDVIGPYGLPVRTTVEVSRFRGASKVEFDAVAHRRA
ncbi:RidA family protein [Gordonia sp. ABSL1-1]|uniref:RidA family protein n=1 Tax=Gordonia sp. ABSL1-1 TaxID=3053923 RepID=UPI002572B27A|nr:RidA family protein [Gordonia sp. ABSL1-1]MDL9938650.1 RidA family protein [Gordonia sp. ABSL1-1]